MGEPKITAGEFLNFAIRWLRGMFGYEVDAMCNIVDISGDYLIVKHPHYINPGTTANINIGFGAYGDVVIDFSEVITNPLRKAIWTSRSFQKWVTKMARNKWNVLPANAEVEVQGKSLRFPRPIPRGFERSTVDLIVKDVYNKICEVEEIILDGLITGELVDAVIISRKLHD